MTDLTAYRDRKLRRGLAERVRRLRTPSPTARDARALPSGGQSPTLRPAG